MIKVPAFYDNLDVDQQRQLHTLVGAESFEWTYPHLRGLPQHVQDWLTKSDHLYRYFKFSNMSKAMEVAAEKGLVRKDDLTPLSALDRARADGWSPTPSLSRNEQQDLNKINMKDVGNGSYNPLGAMGLTREEKWKAVCLHRSRFLGNTRPFKSFGLADKHRTEERDIGGNGQGSYHRRYATWSS